MTISSNLSTVTRNGNGVATSFSFPFKVWDVSQLDVYITDPTGATNSTSNFTAALSGTGGSVTYPASGGTVLPAGWKIVINRNMPFTQNVDLVNGQAFYPDVIEQALDQLTATCQQLDEGLSRSVKVDPGQGDPKTLLTQIQTAVTTSSSNAAAAAGSATDADASKIAATAQANAAHDSAQAAANSASTAADAVSAATAQAYAAHDSALAAANSASTAAQAVETAAAEAVSAATAQANRAETAAAATAVSEEAAHDSALAAAQSAAEAAGASSAATAQADAAANSASTAAQTVTTAAAEAVTAATAQANRAETAATATAVSEEAAAVSARASAASAANSDAGANLAEQWASSPHGSVVENGEYSAKHYAIEAKNAVPDNLVERVEVVEAKTLPATTTARGIGRVATLADMEPRAVVENGPAFLAAGSDAVTPTPTPNTIMCRDEAGRVRVEDPVHEKDVVNKGYVDNNNNNNNNSSTRDVTGSITLNGTTNNTVTMTDIVTELELEIGDVIRIDTGAYNKLHTVESITNNGSIIVNYEHAGNRGDASLKLPNFTGQATVTRIAKWFNAPLGLGQEWVDIKRSRDDWTTYTNTTGRSILVSTSIRLEMYDKDGTLEAKLTVDGVLVAHFLKTECSSGERVFASAIVPAGATYRVDSTYNVLQAWAELR